MACARVLVGEVPDGGAQAVVRGSARCATQALTRDVQADARGTAQCTYLPWFSIDVGTSIP